MNLTRQQIIEQARSPELNSNPVVDRLCDLTIEYFTDSERLRAALQSSRETLLQCGFVGPGPHGIGDPEINKIDAALAYG